MLEQPIVSLVTTPLVAGVVGYITNKIAIKMLFRPYEPKWYTLGWQGIVPKTRPKLAVKISEIVGQKLLAHDDFLYALENNDIKTKIHSIIADKLKSLNAKDIHAVIRLSSLEDKIIDKVAIATGNADTVSRYGSANGEHIVAYKGIDNETGQIYSKGLKQISESRVHPDYKKSNIKQQSGYSAEVKSAAKKNAEKYINGDTKSRASRTDDISMQSDGKGNTIGGINDQLYDIAEIDNNGMYVDGTASQLKFVGGTAEQCAQKLISAKYDKYRDARHGEACL